ncbi:hypothetical protein [Rhizobium terrae]|uniref:hypothetical protein n=1 Tax=Rhizobium terrae TaxID=2171756 RepID=UPI0013C2F218|nr:hypothetical protein [Rhizobium terrae]
MTANTVELIPHDGYWLVRLTENGCQYERDFRFEEHALAWADGQYKRLLETGSTDRNFGTTFSKNPDGFLGG